MERMLVIVFNNEGKAYEGARALRELDAEGSIAVHAMAVIARNADGTISPKAGGGVEPLGGLTGTALGALIGVLGGPVGVALGATTGALVGTLSDLDTAGVGAQFVADVGQTLRAGDVAVVADVTEEWVTPVDARMVIHQERGAGSSLTDPQGQGAEARPRPSSRISSRSRGLSWRARCQHQVGASKAWCRTRSRRHCVSANRWVFGQLR